MNPGLSGEKHDHYLRAENEGSLATCSSELSRGHLIWLNVFSNHIDPIQLIRPTFYRKKGRFYSSAKREILRLNMNELNHNGEKIADE